MQYILSQSEYEDFITKSNTLKGLPDIKTLQQICTKAANEWPIVTWMNDGKPTPWGCIIDTDEEWYCDECPMQKICPNKYKHWSK